MCQPTFNAIKLHFYSPIVTIFQQNMNSIPPRCDHNNTVCSHGFLYKMVLRSYVEMFVELLLCSSFFISSHFRRAPHLSYAS